MIVGEEQADEGDVSVPKKATVGYFRQDVEEMSGRSVLDEAIAGSGRLGSLHHELEELQRAMSDPARAAEMDAILARFGDVQPDMKRPAFIPGQPRLRLPDRIARCAVYDRRDAACPVTLWYEER